MNMIGTYTSHTALRAGLHPEPERLYDQLVLPDTDFQDSADHVISIVDMGGWRGLSYECPSNTLGQNFTIKAYSAWSSDVISVSGLVLLTSDVTSDDGMSLTPLCADAILKISGDIVIPPPPFILLAGKTAAAADPGTTIHLNFTRAR